MALERHLYDDPEKILMRHEAKTCKGCVFEREAFERKYCNMGKRYGRHCKSYDDTKAE